MNEFQASRWSPPCNRTREPQLPQAATPRKKKAGRIYLRADTPAPNPSAKACRETPRRRGNERRVQRFRRIPLNRCDPPQGEASDATRDFRCGAHLPDAPFQQGRPLPEATGPLSSSRFFLHTRARRARSHIRRRTSKRPWAHQSLARRRMPSALMRRRRTSPAPPY